MNSREPKYLSIYERLREDIVNGIYKTGTKIPSKRTFADYNGVSVITVQHAYELLADEGYITGIEKSGYFVSYRADDVFPVGSGNHYGTDTGAIYDRKAKSGQYAESGQCPESGQHPESGQSHDSGKDTDGVTDDFASRFFSFSQYAKTTRKVLAGYADEVFERSDGFGTVALREAIAAYLKRSRRIETGKNRIIVGSGAEYLYGLIVKTLGRDLVYGIESPSYRQISGVYETEGVGVRFLPLEKDGINSDSLWKTDARVLHITPYRSFPSGVTASATKKHEYLRWSAENHAILIEDDFESEFSPSRKPEEALISLGHNENVIYVNTFTKTIGPFIRVAYMVIPNALFPQFEKKVGFYSCPVPTVEQYVLAELLNNGDFERHINRVRRHNRNLC